MLHPITRLLAMISTWTGGGASAGATEATLSGIEPALTSTPGIVLQDDAGSPFGMKLVDGKPRVANTPYGYDVADRKQANHEPVHVTAEVSNATTAWTDMWGGAPATPVCPVLAAAVAMELVSSSAQDAVGGTGISEVEIHYLDGAGVLKSSRQTLLGLTPVALPENVLHINLLHATDRGQAGTSDVVAAGNVDVRGAGGGTVYSRIPAGRTIDPRMVFRIPAGCKGFWSTIIKSVTALAVNSTAQVQIVANQDPETEALLPLGIWLPQVTTQGGQGGNTVSEDLSVPLTFQENVVVKARARRVSGSGNCDAQVTGTGWIEEI